MLTSGNTVPDQAEVIWPASELRSGPDTRLSTSKMLVTSLTADRGKDLDDNCCGLAGESGIGIPVTFIGFLCTGPLYLQEAKRESLPYSPASSD